MKKMMKCSVAFIFSSVLLSCQSTVPQAIPIEETATVFSVHTQTAQTPETTIQITRTPESINPDPVFADINFVPELSGSLFVGSFDTGLYMELDFDDDQATQYQLPKGCELLSNRLEAVCEVNPDSGKAGIYIYNILTEKRGFTEERNVGRWDLTSSEQLLIYTLAEPEGPEISMYSYNLETKTSINVGAFNNNERRLAIPWLSNSAQSMVGLNYDELAWDDDDSWYMMATDTMEDKPIAVPQHIAATDSVQWSPNDGMVALVGFYRTDEDPPTGSIRCTRVVLIYNPTTDTVESQIEALDGRCFTPIALYQDSIWSPDSSKLALVLDQQDICIIHVSDGESNCAPISSYYQTEYKIRSLTWSPDSAYLAFRGFDGSLQVYSLKDRKTYFIADTDDLSPSPIGNILVWTQ